MKIAQIFTKCLGINDAKFIGSQKFDPKTGETEFIDCLNITTTQDNCVEKIAAFTPDITHSATVQSISADTRFIYQDAVDTNEWLGGIVIDTPFPTITGGVIHTPVDVRVSYTGLVYKTRNITPTLVELALVGDNPLPQTSKPYYEIPVYTSGFTYNGTLYLVNADDNRFLQYSEPYSYDLYALGDNFLYSKTPIVQAGGALADVDKSGCIVTMHAEGVTVYVGTNPKDFKRLWYPCDPKAGSLYSGFISKVYGYGHMFLCNDGVYIITANGDLTNLTINQTNYIDTWNTTYTSAIVHKGKYLAFGDVICVEYDVITKTCVKRSSFNVKSATRWNNETYFAVDNTICHIAPDIDTTDNFTAYIVFPYSDFGGFGAKNISDLYFTGTLTGKCTISAIDKTGDNWSVDVEELGTVFGHRIKVPRKTLDNHVSFRIDCLSGAFRLEEFKAVYSTSKNRSK